MKKEATSKDKREVAKKIGLSFVRKDGKIQARQGQKVIAVGKSATKIADVICFCKN